jgi:hypothetical protein
MTDAEIEAKALDLITPVIGPSRGGKLVATVRNLDALGLVRDLRPLLQA